MTFIQLLSSTVYLVEVILMDVEGPKGNTGERPYMSSNGMVLVVEWTSSVVIEGNIW